MRKIIAVVLCLSAFAMVANAAVNRIEFYFSATDSLAGIPAEYTAKTIPTVALNQKAYLWAYVQSSSIQWSAVSVKFAGPAVTAGVMYEPVTWSPDDPTVSYWRRWNVGTDVIPVGDNQVEMVGVPGGGGVTGLGKNFSPGDPPDGDYLTPGAPGGAGTTRHFLIGEVSYANAGAVNLQVGDGFIIKIGTSKPPTDDIYFGFGPNSTDKEHIVLAGGALAYGSDVGAGTATPDLYVVPEPASLLLIGLAGLALRRR